MLIALLISILAAAANGELECMAILKDSGIIYCQNNSGNTPLRESNI